MAQVVSSVRGSASVTHDGGGTTIFTNGSYPCRVIINILGLQLDTVATSQAIMTLYGVTSVGGVNIYNYIFFINTNTAGFTYPILDHFGGTRAGGDTVAAYANLPYGVASSSNMDNSTASTAYLAQQGTYNNVYNRQFWMMPGETLYCRSAFGNLTGTRYWNLTTITEQ
jgi:hypothetical protein